jgi:hypothetical protein
MPAEPEITVVVVSWNCRDLLGACLRSVFAQRGVAAEVFVVDNASADGTVAHVEAVFPAVQVIANDANLGFAKANNQAFRLARGRHVLLLNPDAELLSGDTLRQLVDYMDADASVGATGCMLLDVDGRWQNSAGFRPTPLAVLANSLFLPHLTRNAVRGLALMRPAADGPAEIDVDWVCGACMLVRRDVFTRAGMLDERFFMYGEDIEWGARIRDAGYRITHLPRLTVQHVYAGTRPDRHRVPVAWLDGLARVYMELEPGRSWLFFKACFGAGLALRTVAGLASSLLGGGAWARRRATESAALLRHLLAAPSPLARHPSPRSSPDTTTTRP